MNQNIRKIEKLLDKMSRNPSAELADRLTALLKENSVFVPAVMPPGTSPELLKQMMQHPNQHVPLPEGASPQPGILTNAEGEQFLAVYTTEKELNKGDNIGKFPMILNMPFVNCLNMALYNSDTLSGIVINPFSQNVTLHINQEEQSGEMTEQQKHAFLRRTLEFSVLPGLFRQEAETVLASVKQEAGSYLLDLYEEIYEGQLECPYTADDFDCMTLGISDTLQLTRITMPEENYFPGTCSAVFLTWNPEEKAVGYYLIEKTAEGRRMLQIKAEEKPIVLGEAPPEGSELQAVIELAQG